MKYCTFAGHREVYAAGVAERAAAAIEGLLCDDTEVIFYSGGMGAFDRLCEGAVRHAQRAHPGFHIKLILVLPYLTERLNANKAYYTAAFDEILVLTELIGVHYKSAVQKRNRWMVDRSDALIAYVRRDFGGAYQTLQYAKRRDGLIIQNLAEELERPTVHDSLES